MEKIIKIAKEKNNQYRITLESKEHFLVTEDILVQYRLLKGSMMDEAMIATVKKESNINQGYQLALNYISYQLRSEKEVRSYLKEKEIDALGISSIINKLKELKLVDDDVYAQSYVRTMMRTSDKGPRVIREQLKKRGISEDKIQTALAFFPEEEQLILSKKVAEKAFRKYHNKSFKERKQKVRQHLMTKGFSADCITESLDSLAVEEDTQEELALLFVQGDKLWQKNQRLEPQKRKKKVTQSLFQKGFDYGAIQQYISQKEMLDEEG